MNNNFIDKLYNEIYKGPNDIYEHMPTLSALAKNKRVVEFGVRNGYSTFALLYGQPISLDSYDLNPCSRLEDLYKVASNYATLFSFNIGDSRKVIISETDILFIDTLHTEKQLLQELELHSPKVKEKIIMHDTVTYGEFGEDGLLGLNFAIRTFLQNNIDWIVETIYLNNNGLTILKRIK
jgi:hypothetical protein